MANKRTRHNGEGSIYPYRNGWAAYTWVDKPDGTRGRKYLYGKTRDEVHEKWIKLQARAREGPVPTTAPKLVPYLTAWHRDVVKPNLAPGTAVNYDDHIRLYISPGLGHKRVDRLRVREVQTWLNDLARACQCCAQGKDARRAPNQRRCCALGECCDSRLERSTLVYARAVLRAALNHAILEELITKNPAIPVKLPKVRRRRKRQTWSSDQGRQFLESARADDDPLYAADVMVLVLGLRRGEALGAEWEHVDWAGWDLLCPEHDQEFCWDCQDLYEVSLQVEKQIQRIDGELLHRETKTEASDAPLPLPRICITALRHRMIRQDADRQAAGSTWHDLGLIFTTRYGTPIEPRNFHRSWTARCRKAGVRAISIRLARRTCGSLLADLDVHPRVAMEILRHARFGITMEIYTEVSSKSTREALRRLGESLETG